MANEERDDNELTEKAEKYCQLRAQGFTKTDAAKQAYPDSEYPGRVGWNVEQKPVVQERIRQLQDELAQALGVTREDQVRRYYQLYSLALKDNKLAVAKSMLERIDAICGFEAPRKTESTSIRKGDSFKNEDKAKLEQDIKKFAGIMGNHKVDQTDNSANADLDTPLPPETLQ